MLVYFWLLVVRDHVFEQTPGEAAVQPMPAREANA